ncbi:hypothetical protein RND81_06G071400 [Saponaria officinalis]|uniref:BED-type domain-containing protein n=1 Tax=Saponaria officinalis TaxID=3572 RepID=A0AAW1K4J4_SAPOF
MDEIFFYGMDLPIEEIVLDLPHENDDSMTEVSEFTEFEHRRSHVWKKYFSISPKSSIDNKLRALCKHCKKAKLIADSKYGTTNVKNHLEKCQAYQDYKRKLSPTQRSKAFFDQKIYRDLVAKAIIKHWYPFSWVEHEGNRAIHGYLSDDVKSICRNTAKPDCVKLYTSLKNKLKDTLCNLPGRVCLTYDLWTSCQTEGYLCLTAHFVDVNWKLSSVVLNFCHMEPPHKQAGVKETKALWFDVPTRWNSTYKILDRAIIYRDAFNKLNLVDKTYLHCPDALE